MYATMTSQTHEPKTAELTSPQIASLRASLLERTCNHPLASAQHQTGLRAMASAIERQPDTLASRVEYYLPRPPNVDAALVSMLGTPPYDPIWVQGVINVFGAFYLDANLKPRASAVESIAKVLGRMEDPSMVSSQYVVGKEKATPESIIRSIDLPSLYLIFGENQIDSDINYISERVQRAKSIGELELRKEGNLLMQDVGLAPLSFALASTLLPSTITSRAYGTIDREFPGYVEQLPRQLAPTRYQLQTLASAEPAK